MKQNAAVNAAEEVQDTRSHHLVNTRLEVLETNWAKFQVEHEKICHTPSEGILKESYVKHRTYERCQEFYVQARALLLEQQESIETSNSGSRLSDFATPETRHSNARRSLPKISLLTFAGDYHSWRSFHDLFVSMVVDNNDLTSVERMHYLKTCLSGDAARLVTNLKVTDNTFSIAWKTLIARYENKRYGSSLRTMMSPLPGPSSESLVALGREPGGGLRGAKGTPSGRLPAVTPVTAGTLACLSQRRRGDRWARDESRSRGYSRSAGWANKIEGQVGNMFRGVRQDLRSIISSTEREGTSAWVGFSRRERVGGG
ncbi:hypothetical protein ALC60_10226 [Trachymyrmex zeteki]|uniref:Uncharacterized protein n=1 Tax=Mycetomoellerius zeteki TaxID=64791 RepID=A0A151WS92_9HYME|nr:hypothetical protein ALC60_10226 [Trachymyrmex zeteki]